MDNTAHLRKGLAKSKHNVFTDTYMCTHTDCMVAAQARKSSGLKYVVIPPTKISVKLDAAKPRGFQAPCNIATPGKKFQEPVGPLHFDTLREQQRKDAQHNDLNVRQAGKA